MRDLIHVDESDLISGTNSSVREGEIEAQPGNSSAQVTIEQGPAEQRAKSGGESATEPLPAIAVEFELHYGLEIKPQTGRERAPSWQLVVEVQRIEPVVVIRQVDQPDLHLSLATVEPIASPQI